MKRCPKCKRTYADDAFTFCLEDGALLSAPYDSEKKEEPISTIQSGGPPPTAVLPDRPRTEETQLATAPAPTIASSPQPPERFGAEPPTRTGRSRKRLTLLFTVPVVVVLLAGLGILALYWNRQSKCWTTVIVCKPEPRSAGSSSNYVECLLGANRGGISRQVADSYVRDVQWTLSTGRKPTLTMGPRILFNTDGLTGQQITVTATFASTLKNEPVCETTASTRFVAQ